MDVNKEKTAHFFKTSFLFLSPNVYTPELKRKKNYLRINVLCIYIVKIDEKIVSIGVGKSDGKKNQQIHSI